MIHKLIFDTTSIDTINASAQVGAILYDKVSGNLGSINGSNELLVKDTDVLSKLNSGVVVTASDLDIRDLVFATDKVDVSNSVIALDAATLAALETVTVEQGTSPWVVSATGLDIRVIDHGTDSIKIGDGTEFLAINVDGSINITDNGGSLTVDAVDLDIRDLSAAQDSVASYLHDGAGTALTSTLEGGKQALDVYVANSIDVDDGLANTAILAVAETVGTSAALIMDAGDELAARKYALVYNNGNREVFIGQSGINTGSGFPLPPGSMLELRVGDAVDVYAIGDAAGQDVRTLQLS